MTSDFEILSNEFQAILGPSPSLELISGGFTFTEGTTYHPGGDFALWSDGPANRILRWSERDGVSVFREPSGKGNGNTVDLEGRVLTCETFGRRVSRVEHNGSVKTLVDSYGGRRLTSPNDIVVKSDGSVWFTDPDYGVLEASVGHGQPSEQERNRVYRFEPDSGLLESAADDFEKPNGICFSPDESILYVGDTSRTHSESGTHHVRAFDVAGSRLSNGRVLCVVDPHVPDGMRVDVDGNLYITAGDGVQVFNPDGELLGKIKTPEIAANCTFAQPDLSALIVAATSSIWRIRLNTAGAARPS